MTVADRCGSAQRVPVAGTGSPSFLDNLPPDAPSTWAARAERGEVALHTLCYRARGRPSIQDKARDQRYLIPDEENAFVAHLLLSSDLGYPIRVKHIPSLAFLLACRRSTADRPIKPPGKNWARAFEKGQPKLQAQRVKPID